MQKVSIETTQNVNIEYQLASVGDRIVAFLIDSGIKVVWVLIGMMLMSAAAASADEAVTIAFIALFFLPLIFYHLLCEIFMDGQSIGKKQMNIKVVKLDGAQPTFGAYLIRWIMRIVDMIFYYGVALLVIVLNKRGQRLGDILAGTTVIKLHKEEELVYHKSIDDPEETYQPVYLQATKLSDRDVEIIKQALNFYRDTGNVKPVLATAEKAKELLGVEPGQPPVKFLNILLKDYNYLAARIPE